MAGNSRWPSRWWFWGVLLVANLYLAAATGVIVLGQTGAFSRPVLGEIENLAQVFVLPVILFAEHVMTPLVEGWGFPKRLVFKLLLGIATWEALTVLVGLVVYSAVALVYVIVPAVEGRGGERSNGPS